MSHCDPRGHPAILTSAFLCCVRKLFACQDCSTYITQKFPGHNPYAHWCLTAWVQYSKCMSAVRNEGSRYKRKSCLSVQCLHHFLSYLLFIWFPGVTLQTIWLKIKHDVSYSHCTICSHTLTGELILIHSLHDWLENLHSWGVHSHTIRDWLSPISTFPWSFFFSRRYVTAS